jgi:hypothetical protein
VSTVNAALTAGASQTSVAKSHGLSRFIIRRHIDLCWSAEKIAAHRTLTEQLAAHRRAGAKIRKILNRPAISANRVNRETFAHNPIYEARALLPLVKDAESVRRIRDEILISPREFEHLRTIVYSDQAENLILFRKAVLAAFDGLVSKREASRA